MLKGERAENVASWYFRLNGFTSIPGFIVHPDRVEKHPRTEADFIAVRFPYSTEILANREMKDDTLLISLTSEAQIIFVLCEVKSGKKININEAWRSKSKKNIQHVIRRMGFENDKTKIDTIANEVYDTGLGKSKRYILQHVMVANRKDNNLARERNQILQITFNDISDFLYKRFSEFPEKLPISGYPVHQQWPDFGKKYGEYFRETLARIDKDKALKYSSLAVKNYIDTGKCE